MQTLTLNACVENLPEVQAFIRYVGKKVGFNAQALYRLELCAEEIFLNICKHAYKSQDGVATICANQYPQLGFCICFEDEGPFFNPLLWPEPDLTASAECRKPGGLGIAMVRRYFPAAFYMREGNKNIIRLPIEKTSGTI